VTGVVFYPLPENSLLYGEIEGGCIGLRIGEGRVTEQPKVCVVFSN